MCAQNIGGFLIRKSVARANKPFVAILKHLRLELLPAAMYRTKFQQEVRKI
jgi:hypothetical protein